MDNFKIHGVVAEFNNPHDLLLAASKVHEAGYVQFDTHSPFPIHGMDEAMELKRSPLGWMVGIMSLFGAGMAMFFQWWSSAIDYPLVISGKPFFSYPAFVPITFGIAVLLGAFTCFFGMLALNKLPQLHHPVFFSDLGEKISDNGFLLSISADDKLFDQKVTAQFLQRIGANKVEVIEGQ